MRSRPFPFEIKSSLRACQRGRFSVSEHKLQRELGLARGARADLTSVHVGDCLANPAEIGVECRDWGLLSRSGVGHDVIATRPKPSCCWLNRRANTGVRGAEIRMVQDIEEVCAELQL